MLTFSLEHEVEGLLAAPDAAGGGEGGGLDAAATAAAAADARQRVRAIMGGHPGGPALVASLYRPVLQFAEAAERHVSGLVGAAEPQGRVAALLALPWRSEAAAAERCLLRGYVESFLRMEFLPAVYVSARWGGGPAAGLGCCRQRGLLCCGLEGGGFGEQARLVGCWCLCISSGRGLPGSQTGLQWRATLPRRARCSAALEDADAFKPRSRLRAPYQLGGGAEGRPVLPAALAAERMIEELLGWAAQVPPFATHLTGMWWGGSWGALGSARGGRWVVHGGG